MQNTASTVPPFIPGLLIVSLLVIISLLIAWRNYARRGNPRLMPGIGEWTFWEAEGIEGTNRPEKPKMWEVGVGGRAESEKALNESGWEMIMPLSATSLTPEPPPPGVAQVSEVPPSQTTHHSSSRLPRLNFLSPNVPTPSPPSPPPPVIPPHRLQVSVLISMPSPNLPTRTRTRLRNSSASSPPPPSDPELGSEAPPRASTSSSLLKEVPADYDVQELEEEEEEEEEGAPDVAFGVAVLPWRKAEEKEEELGQTNISVA